MFFIAQQLMLLYGQSHSYKPGISRSAWFQLILSAKSFLLSILFFKEGQYESPN